MREAPTPTPSSFERSPPRCSTTSPTTIGMDGLVAQQMVINLRLHDPSADIWVDGRTRPVATTFEPIGVDATLTATLSADSMHELLLGTLPLGKAMLFRKLKVAGSRSRALKLEPLQHACQAVYPGIVDRPL